MEEAAASPLSSSTTLTNQEAGENQKYEQEKEGGEEKEQEKQKTNGTTTPIAEKEEEENEKQDLTCQLVQLRLPTQEEEEEVSEEEEEEEEEEAKRIEVQLAQEGKEDVEEKKEPGQDVAEEEEEEKKEVPPSQQMWEQVKAFYFKMGVYKRLYTLSEKEGKTRQSMIMQAMKDASVSVETLVFHCRDYATLTEFHQHINEDAEKLFGQEPLFYNTLVTCTRAQLLKMWENVSNYIFDQKELEEFLEKRILAFCVNDDVNGDRWTMGLVAKIRLRINKRAIATFANSLDDLEKAAYEIHTLPALELLFQYESRFKQQILDHAVQMRKLMHDIETEKAGGGGKEANKTLADQEIAVRKLELQLKELEREPKRHGVVFQKEYSCFEKHHARIRSEHIIEAKRRKALTDVQMEYEACKKLAEQLAALRVTTPELRDAGLKAFGIKNIYIDNVDGMYKFIVCSKCQVTLADEGSHENRVQLSHWFQIPSIDGMVRGGRITFAWLVEKVLNSLGFYYICSQCKERNWEMQVTSQNKEEARQTLRDAAAAREKQHLLLFYPQKG